MPSSSPHKILTSPAARLLKVLTAPLVVCASFISIWVLYPDWLPLIYPSLESQDAEDRGDFGDYFGALNTIFSGLALCGILFSLVYQAKGLSEARRAMEIEGQRWKQEAFDSTFFQLLQLFNENINAIEEFTELEQQRGRALLRFIHHEFATRGFRQKVGIEDNEVLNSRQEYLIFFNRWINILDQYFATLTEILLQIDLAAIDEDRKLRYARVLKSQLSWQEVALLFQHCLSDHGSAYLMGLTEKYGILSNLKYCDYIDNSDILLFKRSAFGDSDIYSQAKEASSS